MDKLQKTLKATFGYDGFRPLQREIMEANLGGRDTFALLPTGGGKSLCFQLPALLREGLTLVVSPLIALMKDQVNQLEAAGVEATFLNSSLGVKETKARLAGLHQGRYKLLYAAPERLMLDHWQENLRAWNVAAIAIDEAHCISEWGHDFRPEYRQIARLREWLPDIPLMALTATATERVRDDIVKHLRLRGPEVFVASFNRPNLSYRVIPKEQPTKQILDFIKSRPMDSGIVYCATRASADRVAESLSERGFPAVPYHAGLTNNERAQNQELFIRDETRIVCATIAFGMGINKPNVRWVIHHDLPKNIEGYYQETGRAGRDGLPGDCLLLFSAGDAAKQTHFIDEMSDGHEQRIAREQLRLMMGYADCPTCRRRELLNYFAETYTEPNCGSCDNCLQPRENYNATTQAQKLLSCVYRVRQGGRFGVGMNHLIEILTGSANEKIQRWGHDKLTTYGIGKDLTRPQWSAIGRDLLRLGYLAQDAGQFPTIALTDLGLDALKSRRVIMLSKPVELKKISVPRTGEIECDETLFDRLRKLRKRLADERGVPAYVIFGDNTLRQMAREYPTHIDALRVIGGMGEKKLAEFGNIFTNEVAAYLQTYPKVDFGGRGE
ncbi:MAG: DNA helicase RecQ [Proteobacteria bacterium]|jgi:ATP-dependent DNA helicase RecQ|nr:DNA helicase RecQ [Pseudomonadota bacterium]